MSTRSKGNNNSFDVVVVGGGLAGLIAANRLLDQNLSVLLMERGQNGGRATTANRQGFRLNQGPHAIYEKGQLLQTAKDLGVEPDRKKVSGAMFAAVDKQTTTSLPTGPVSLLRSSALKFGSKRQLLTMFKTIEKQDLKTLADLTAAQWVQNLTEKTDLQDLLHALTRLATYSGLSEQMSADVAALQLTQSLGGVSYIHQGWQQLVDALTKRAKTKGLTTVKSRVDQVTTTEGVTSAGRKIEVTGDTQTAVADAVVVAVGSPEIAAGIVGAEPSALAGRPTGWVSALDLGLTATPKRQFLLGIEQPLYFSVQSRGTDGVSAPGHHLATVARYGEPNAPQDEIKKQLMDFARLAGVEKATVGMERFSFKMPAVYGVPTPETGGMPGRPSVSAAEQPGVYLAGDWVGPQGFLSDASAASANEASAAVIAHLAQPSGRQR